MVGNRIRPITLRKYAVNNSATVVAGQDGNHTVGKSFHIGFARENAFW
jgi:hypothetical protein